MCNIITITNRLSAHASLLAAPVPICDINYLLGVLHAHARVSISASSPEPTFALLVDFSCEQALVYGILQARILEGCYSFSRDFNPGMNPQLLQTPAMHTLTLNHWEAHVLGLNKSGCSDQLTELHLWFPLKSPGELLASSDPSRSMGTSGSISATISLKLSIRNQLWACAASRQTGKQAADLCLHSFSSPVASLPPTADKEFCITSVNFHSGRLTFTFPVDLKWVYFYEINNWTLFSLGLVCPISFYWSII